MILFNSQNLQEKKMEEEVEEKESKKLIHIDEPEGGATLPHITSLTQSSLRTKVHFCSIQDHADPAPWKLSDHSNGSVISWLHTHPQGCP